MPSGAGSANRRAIIVDYARFISNPPQRRGQGIHLNDSARQASHSGLPTALLAKFDGGFACDSGDWEGGPRLKRLLSMDNPLRVPRGRRKGKGRLHGWVLASDARVPGDPW